ncbi:MAG: guanylate kinase [Planctomycetia bacterium]|nr:guanylate kinase [Planctomycetia bacterium]MBL6915799.1 guanylate kinase [Planctomycetota bacterium]
MTEENSVNGILVVLSGPSGVGKTALSDRVIAMGDYVRAITATTRSPRDGEKNGVDYHFLDRSAFEVRIGEKGFLEYAEVHGNLYGSPRQDIEKQQEAARAVLLLIDVQGAENLRRHDVDALHVFLEPPSLEELQRRLANRGDETEQEIKLRLENALAELKHKDRYDHCVVNSDLGRATDQLIGIIEAEWQRRNG